MADKTRDELIQTACNDAFGQGKKICRYREDHHRCDRMTVRGPSACAIICKTIDALIKAGDLP